jgi:hypothetical protein
MSRARCSTERGGYTFPELGPTASVTGSQERRGKRDQETRKYRKGWGANLESDKKHLPR